MTANTATTVTLDDAGTMAIGDYFLPAPLFDHYRFLGDAYFEAGAGSLAELRSLADTGREVRTKNGFAFNANDGFVTTGVVASWTKINPGGRISPMATGIFMRHTLSLSSGATGSLAEHFGTDNSDHEVDQTYQEKTSAVSEVHLSKIEVTFSFGPYFYNKTGGSMTAARAATLNVRGYILE